MTNVKKKTKGNWFDEIFGFTKRKSFSLHSVANFITDWSKENATFAHSKIKMVI